MLRLRRAERTEATKKAAPTSDGTAFLPVMRQKSRYVRAQQKTGQSSAQQKRRREADFVLRKSGGIADVHHDFPAFTASFLKDYEMRTFFSRKNVERGKKNAKRRRKRADAPTSCGECGESRRAAPTAGLPDDDGAENLFLPRPLMPRHRLWKRASPVPQVPAPCGSRTCRTPEAAPASRL